MGLYGVARVQAAPIRIACAGTSITAGAGLQLMAQKYPARLQALLGPGYVVGNFGVIGATALRNTSLPYCTTAVFRSVFTFAPDWIIIELGTNDSPPAVWNPLKSGFAGDMRRLVDTFQTMSSVKRVWLCTPPPAFSYYHSVDSAIISQQIAPLIRRIAHDDGLGLAELHDLLLPYPECFPDGVHPNAEGAGFIAQIVHDALLPAVRIAHRPMPTVAIPRVWQKREPVLRMGTRPQVARGPAELFDIRGQVMRQAGNAAVGCQGHSFGSAKSMY
jgi:lysophospholipase L1-like esterase